MISLAPFLLMRNVQDQNFIYILEVQVHCGDYTLKDLDPGFGRLLESWCHTPLLYTMRPFLAGIGLYLTLLLV